MFSDELVSAEFVCAVLPDADFWQRAGYSQSPEETGTISSRQVQYAGASSALVGRWASPGTNKSGRTSISPSGTGLLICHLSSLKVYPKCIYWVGFVSFLPFGSVCKDKTV
jgi:hypothetical protein